MTAVPQQRARRLLRWYPAAWRARYGDEFAELLAADIAERPRSPRRGADVAANGLRARLACAGLTAYPPDPAAARQARLTVLASCAAAFAAVGGAMWSQLAIGLQWTAPADHSVTQALGLMSAALLVLAVVTVLAAIPVLAAASAAFARGTGRALIRPGLLVVAGIAIYVVGGRHFGNGWPGTGGHLLVHEDLVPAGVAAFCWATTMWITSYWAHPAALAAFPAAELGWMLLSPVAAAAVVTGAVRLRARVGLSPRALRYEAFLAVAAAAAMALFVGGTLRWLSSSGGVAPSLVRPGLIDRAGLALLAVAACVAVQAVRSARPRARAGGQP